MKNWRKDKRSSMECGSVVPDSDVIDSPLVPHLQVVVLRYVAEEEVQKVIGLLRVQLEDTLSESGEESSGELNGQKWVIKVRTIGSQRESCILSQGVCE